MKKDASWNLLNGIFEGFKKFPLFKWIYKLSWAPGVYHFFLALLGVIIYRFPGRKILVIGITGTKGKTTTVELLKSVLQKSGDKTASLSSAYISIGDKIDKNPFGNSMPGRFFVQYFLRKAVNEGCKYAVIEVTSQGVVQHRHNFIPWSKAMFLNIHPEHIESHGSFEKYLEAKVEFFKYAAHSNKKSVFFMYSKDKYVDVFKEVIGRSSNILFSEEDIKDFDFIVPQPLKGDFNRINIAAVVAVAKNLNIPKENIKKGIEDFIGVKGRMEVVIKDPFWAVVDYAHTPESLEAVYHYWKNEINLKNKLICVLGSAGGGRDKWKRIKFGEVAGSYCDKIILTNEDPYDEPPISIIEEIEKGLLNSSNSNWVLEKNYWKIIDRQEAVNKAVVLAKNGDAVICTGKGSEEWIHLENGKKTPWSERESLLKALSFKK